MTTADRTFGGTISFKSYDDSEGCVRPDGAAISCARIS
jgi:hypothetical protein